MLAELSRAYGDIKAYAEGLLVLRRSRAIPSCVPEAALGRSLSEILDRCLGGRPEAISGSCSAAQQQGAALQELEPQARSMRSWRAAVALLPPQAPSGALRSAKF